MKAQHRKWLLRSIGLILLVGIFYKVGDRAVLDTLRRADIRLLLLAAGLCFAQFILKAVRWDGILRRAGVKASWHDVSQAYFSSAFVGLFTPGRLGELSKAYLVRRWDAHVSWGTALGTVVLDRLLDVGAFGVVAVWGLARVGLPGSYRAAGEVGVVLLLLGGMFAAAMALRGLATLPVVRSLAGHLDRKIGPSSGDFLRVIKQAIQLRSAMTYALTVVCYALFYGYFIALARSMGSVLPWHVLIWGISIGSLASLLPISIGGIGVRDFTLLAIFKTWGEAAGTTLAISLSYLAMLYLVVAALGCWPLLTGTLKTSALKKMTLDGE